MAIALGWYRAGLHILRLLLITIHKLTLNLLLESNDADDDNDDDDDDDDDETKLSRNRPLRLITKLKQLPFIRLDLLLESSKRHLTNLGVVFLVSYSVQSSQ